MQPGPIDTAAIARLMAQIADQPGDRAEAFFEHRFERLQPPSDEGLSPREWCEEGFAVRLVRAGRAWHASRDGLAGTAFVEALRQVARAQPRTALVEPAMPESAAWFEDATPLQDFPRWVERAIRAEHVAFPLRLALRQHARAVLVVGSRLVAERQSERFCSVVADLPWGRMGALLPRLDEVAATALAGRLVARFRARFAEPPASGRTALVLAPDAAAVLLHEAVAHALEADLLSLSGRPEAALGVQLGARCLNVLDAPETAPETVRRSSDDEGMPVLRRWLLRGGVVEQPLADGTWADASAALLPGAARRGHRHDLPGPRSSHLELLPGDADEPTLLAAGDAGLWVNEVDRGALDPWDGSFTLAVPCARRITGGALGEPVGPFRVRGTVAGLLSAVVAVGRDVRPAGAGWCAKGGQALPVWATVPALCIEAVDVEAS